MCVCVCMLEPYENDSLICAAVSLCTLYIAHTPTNTIIYTTRIKYTFAVWYDAEMNGMSGAEK